MSFADWTTAGNLSGGHTLPPITPIQVDYPAVGVFDPNQYMYNGQQVDFAANTTKALVLAGDGPSALRWGAAINRSEPYTVMRGRLRALVRIHPTHSGPANMGIAALLSQEDLAPGQGAKGYALTLDTLFSEPRIRLVQLTDGVAGPPKSAFGTSYVLLAETDVGVFAFGEPVLLELRFHSDPVQLKGTHLQAYYQTLETPLTLLWEIVYTGATAHKPTESKGCAVICGLGTNNVITYCDDVEVFGEGED